MKIFSEIFATRELIDNPPVLVDIGASGELNKKWKSIAKHSICIAFDADERKMDYVVKEDTNYKKLYVFNKIVTDEESQQSDFYLTKSPYCSSLLKPDQAALTDWFNKDLFTVKQIKQIPTITLKYVLNKLNIEKIDWFKADAQRIDLRLFKSLGQNLIQKTLVAEFEPGIRHVYQGEDKLYDTMSFMDKISFGSLGAILKGHNESIGNCLMKRLILMNNTCIRK